MSTCFTCGKRERLTKGETNFYGCYDCVNSAQVRGYCGLCEKTKCGGLFCEACDPAQFRHKHDKYKCIVCGIKRKSDPRHRTCESCYHRCMKCKICMVCLHPYVAGEEIATLGTRITTICKTCAQTHHPNCIYCFANQQLPGKLVCERCYELNPADAERRKKYIPSPLGI